MTDWKKIVFSVYVIFITRMVMSPQIVYLSLVALPQVKEVTIDYTDCKNQNDIRCSEVISQNKDATCNCTIPFELQQDFTVGVSVV